MSEWRRFGELVSSSAPTGTQRCAHRLCCCAARWLTWRAAACFPSLPHTLHLPSPCPHTTQARARTSLTRARCSRALRRVSAKGNGPPRGAAVNRRRSLLALLRTHALLRTPFPQHSLPASNTHHITTPQRHRRAAQALRDRRQGRAGHRPRRPHRPEPPQGGDGGRRRGGQAAAAAAAGRRVMAMMAATANGARSSGGGQRPAAGRAALMCTGAAWLAGLLPPRRNVCSPRACAPDFQDLTDHTR